MVIYSGFVHRKNAIFHFVILVYQRTHQVSSNWLVVWNIFPIYWEKYSQLKPPTSQSLGPPSHPIRPGSAPGLVAGGSGKFERDNGGIAWEIDVYIYIIILYYIILYILCFIILYILCISIYYRYYKSMGFVKLCKSYKSL